MTYRDDRDAALARAEALARQLEDERRRREDAEARLADEAHERARLADALARRDADAPRPAAADAAQAHRELEALAARGPTPSPAPASAPPALPVDRATPRARRRRLVRSADRLAALATEDVAVLALVSALAVGLSAYVIPRPIATGLMLAAPVVVLLATTVARLTGPSRIRRWAARRRYRLAGLDAALEVPPPSQLDRRPIAPPVRRDDGHARLVVELVFAEDAPAVLAAALRAFDPELDVSVSGARAIATRESPITTRPRRTGVPDVRDHNHAALAWLRRLDREVLDRLHRAHGLREVTFELTSRARA